MVIEVSERAETDIEGIAAWWGQRACRRRLRWSGQASGSKRRLSWARNCPPFKRSRGGPGGWSILDEPELHLDEHVLVPDLAGWRRETLRLLPEGAYLSVRPDWVCEVISPSTRMHDRALKMPIYQEQGVGHVWLVDPEARTLEVFRLESIRKLALGLLNQLVLSELS